MQTTQIMDGKCVTLGETSHLVNDGALKADLTQE